MATTQYIGARYVPLFFTNPDDNSNNWKSGIVYDPLTVVTDLNQSYTSKIPVPASVGRPSENPTYWILTGAYSAQIEQYRQEVEDLDGNVTELSNTVQTLSNDVSALEAVEPIAGILRKENGIWKLLTPDSGHTPLHLSNVSIVDNTIKISFDKTYSSVGSISITPDECYGLGGLGAGVSVGSSVIIAHLFRTRPYSGWFDFDSSGKVSYPTGGYKGDIDNVVYDTQRSAFVVTFKDYTAGGTENGFSYTFAKDALNVEPWTLGMISNNSLQIGLYANQISSMSNGGRVWVQLYKQGYDLSPSEFPELEYGNFWISGYMIP